jgi:DNA-binding CsgD family transcriptional regulator
VPCKCIQVVHRGQVWASSQQIDYLIDLISQVPSLRVINANGNRLLTPREEQVVALVAEGLSNREIAQELKLSEHTIKKYVFRIFDKLGISTRVELVLYAVNPATTAAPNGSPAARSALGPARRIVGLDGAGGGSWVWVERRSQSVRGNYLCVIRQKEIRKTTARRGEIS